MSISQNLDELRATIPKDVKLIAISKTRSREEILEAYRCGQREFGENRPQELTIKASNLPSDIQWHLYYLCK